MQGNHRTTSRRVVQLRSRPTPTTRLPARRYRTLLVAATTALSCLVLVLSVPPVARADWSFLDSWKAHPPFSGPVPQRSDVIFSTRFKRQEAPEVARLFGATRIEWVYSSDPAYIATLRNVAPWFGGAVNSTIPLDGDQGIAKDIEGKAIIAPWMRSWAAKWITVADEKHDPP